MTLYRPDGIGRRRLSAHSASSSASASAMLESSSGSSDSFVGDAVVGSSSTSGSSSVALASRYGDESSSASSDADLMYRRTQGSCAYYPVSAGGCRAPRSCFDCLNYNVAPDRAGCMVNEQGQCVSMTGNYTAARDYHFASAVNAVHTTSGSSSLSGSVDISAALNSGPGAEFPAANASYCAWSDAKCAACRKGDFLEFPAGAITRTSLFCLGQDGCVCIALCELDDWADRAGGSQCTNTTAGEAGSGSPSTAGNMTPVNSGAGGDSTQGGVAGQGDSDDGSGGIDTFWSAAGGVLAVLVAALAVVMFLSKRHRESRRSRQQLGTPQAPTLSPRGEERPPESLIAVLLRRSNRRAQSRRMGSTTAENSTDADTTEGDTSGDDGRSLRLFGWRAMRQQVMEKETLHPVVVSSGIRRVAISHCLPGDVGRGDSGIDSECAPSPRRLPTPGLIEEDEMESAILGDTRDSRRFRALSLASSAMLSPPSYVIPLEDEHDDGGDGDRSCFGELVTPPARSRMLL